MIYATLFLFPSSRMPSLLHSCSIVSIKMEELSRHNIFNSYFSIISTISRSFNDRMKEWNKSKPHEDVLRYILHLFSLNYTALLWVNLKKIIITLWLAFWLYLDSLKRVFMRWAGEKRSLQVVIVELPCIKWIYNLQSSSCNSLLCSFHYVYYWDLSSLWNPSQMLWKTQLDWDFYFFCLL